MELETQRPPEVVFRLGRKPDPWQPPPWSLANSADGTRNDLMETIGQARKESLIDFPETNGPISWPPFELKAVLGQVSRVA